MPSKNKKARKTRTNTKRNLLIAVVIVLLVAFGGWKILDSKQVKSGVIPSNSSDPNKTLATTSSDNSSSPKQTSNQSTSSVSQKAVAGDSSDSSIVPTAPTGDFVSNHHPNLSGSPAPSKEQSICDTTPGASCYIEFTQGSIVKTLPTQVADADGVVVWSWDVNSAGFGTGNWKITAVASGDGQTKTSSDAQDLDVQP